MNFQARRKLSRMDKSVNKLNKVSGESMADENASNVGMEREKLQTINFSLNLSHCSTLVSGMGSGVWSS